MPSTLAFEAPADLGGRAIAFGDAIRGEFALEPDIAFLNHGSYGATPRRVLAAAEEWRRRMEAQPVRFMQRELPDALRAAAGELARFLGAAGDDLVFVDNATTGVNAVLRSLELTPADEVLFLSHVYGAVRNTIAHVCARTGAKPLEVAVPFPLAGAEEVLAPVAKAITARTRIAVLDHVTSSTALVLPIDRLIELCHARDVAVLVDGAHAPGMLALDLAALGADWYVGNCHKWLFAPKGCGLLWAAPCRRAGLHPTVISHGFGHGFTQEFDWTGTRDGSAWLAVTAALDFLRALGPAAVRAHNHALAIEAAKLINDAWWTPIGGPPAMLGSMAALRLAVAAPATREAAAAIHDRLWDEHRIEAPVMPFGQHLWVRISAQVYNSIDDYRRLAAVSIAPTIDHNRSI